MKLKLFAHSLTNSALAWYTNWLQNSIQTLQEMEQKFYEQFYITESKVSWLTYYIAWFKVAKNRCHLEIPECEIVKVVHSSLRYKLKKKFKGTKFINLFELVSYAIIYEEILKEEYKMKNSSWSTYY